MSEGGRKQKTACVTGGNGYIASVLIKMLLENGYAVKTTVRNPDDMAKNSHLKDMQAVGPLTVLRADLLEEGSFDEAVAGCDYAFLIAAPVNLHSKNPEKELIEPAVRGILNVMRSCAKAGTVKRVILTSSAAAVAGRPLQGGGHVLDEESWTDVEYLTAKKSSHWVIRKWHHKCPVPVLVRIGRMAPSISADDEYGTPSNIHVLASQGYGVSKVLAEKEACRFAKEHGINFVSVCPVLTVGAAPATKMDTSLHASLSLLSGDEAAFRVLRGIEMATGCMPLVHAADLCRAQMFVAEEDAAAGRYICCSVNTTIVELAHFLADKYPQYTVKTHLLSSGVLEKPRVSLSSARLLGEGFKFKYETLDEIYDDVVAQGKALGVLPN